MLVPILLVQGVPRDITPPDAIARRMFYKPEQIDAWNGLGSLRKHLLPPGDLELRYWRGFAC